MDGHSRIKLPLSLLTLLVVGVLVAQAAWAGSVAIDDVELAGGQASIFDAEGYYSYNVVSDSGGPCISKRGYTPADDGSNGAADDAFDGGLYLVVKGKTFGKGKEMGNEQGESLTVKQTFEGIAITRTDRALQDTPTLRTLIRFKNTTNDAQRRKIVWDSAMGADDSEDTRASSSGNMAHAKADRWIVASDDPVSPDDPPILFVFFGRGAGVPVDQVLFAPEDPDPGDPNPGEGCVAVSFQLRIPPDGVRYLLFFTELFLNTSNDEAIGRGPTYNDRNLTNTLLMGIPDSVRAKVGNWDLT